MDTKVFNHLKADRIKSIGLNKISVYDIIEVHTGLKFIAKFIADFNSTVLICI